MKVTNPGADKPHCGVRNSGFSPDVELPEIIENREVIEKVAENTEVLENVNAFLERKKSRPDFIRNVDLALDITAMIFSALFVVELLLRMAALGVELKLDILYSTLTEAAEETLGRRHPARAKWMSEGTWELVLKRKKKKGERDEAATVTSCGIQQHPQGVPTICTS
ncbi:unnamed protein product [Cyprideis torosa]|uniref:Uncharacterized protein n=1 Tax=Cyprideis torosa TaxID=163714 RepID=A0A7R8ZT98_9CRUS|nr:unnamed protein product [Cyprideis torosa]CAG0903504.1 unnamed protein product [Cyprideis torosa]